MIGSHAYSCTLVILMHLLGPDFGNETAVSEMLVDVSARKQILAVVTFCSTTGQMAGGGAQDAQ